ncbi:MAG: alanine:cation symporter family protein [Saprospiraceae bacterium]|nr:alanine:cation symporter family protein [Saprospiraceae bacterium]MBK8370607.1 alanine:cation symporter family protein [Saprospiraceae bacterium]MBK8546473.1 alanine:cation symporter family protein [Saprospiraceae bacterium]MBK8854540.1 alanine:cation symporter family protein [Saprospiraceae bacterium]MBK9044503.1 alanine:cation symporter family protein [Saprospiraceae bacterium]
MKPLKVMFFLLILFFSQIRYVSAQTSDTLSTTVQTNAPEMGIDDKINAAFEPVAAFIGGIILYQVPIGGVEAPLIVIILTLGGLFFTFYFGFPNIRNFGTAIQVVRGKYDKVEQKGAVETHPEETVFTVDGDIAKTIRDEHHHGEVSHFQALATAVSGTVGLGNIAGVTLAVSLGGPGATFWMIVSGLLGMTLKFVECTLGVHYRDINKQGVVFGGPMYYLSKGLKEKGYTGLGKFLAVVFAILCVGGSFGGGNAAQSNQAAEQLISLFGMTGGSSGFIIGIFIAVLVGITIIGGIKRIASVTEKLVPFMAIIYIGACLVVILSHFSYMDDAIALIIEGAFNPQAGIGGMIGVMVIGFRRAAFSNEAGAGSASIAHSAVKTKYSASEGLVSLLEPFIDTVVICTMTALVIVTFNEGNFFEYGQAAVTINGTVYQGATLTSLAFEQTISWFPIVLTIAIFLFAISTMISWSYYGQQAWMYLFGKSKGMEMTYKIIFLIFIVIGASANMQSIWDFSDAMILGMVFPNMVGLLILFPKVKEELARYLAVIKNKK